MPTFEWSRPAPRLKPTVIAEISEMLLPVYGWSAPVTKRVRTELSVFERFTIEAAIELGEFTATDLAEVTGLPVEVVERTVHRLASADVLATDPADPTGGPHRRCRPDPAKAGAALEGAEVFEYRSDRLQFLYLPNTDELLALGRAKRLPRVDPAHEAPMPEVAVGRERWRFLDERIEAGAVADLPAEIVKAESEPILMPETCPAYRCTGELTENGPLLNLVDDSGRKKRQPYPLESANALASYLGAFVNSIERAFEDLTDEPVELRQLDGDVDAHWGFAISGELAEKLVEDGRSLTGPLRLNIADHEVRLSLGARIEPGDNAARAVFALDLAVTELKGAGIGTLTDDVLKATAVSAGQQYGVEVEPDAVRDELWRRRDFHRVYLLRAAKDFPYD